MKQQSKLELVVGVFVLAGLAAVGYLALRIGAGALVGADSYSLQARFTNSGGLNPGSNVVVSGVSVGRVDSVRLNTDDYSSLVRFSVRKDVRLPLDTIASIRTTGLIGDKFLALAPGGESDYLEAGALITDTESTVDLESLISRFAFGNVADTPKPSEPAAGAPAAQP